MGQGEGHQRRLGAFRGPLAFGIHAGRLFKLLDAFYPVPSGKKLRPTPFMPYLSFAPSAWVLPLRFTGGGLSGANLWIGDRFSASSRRRDLSNPATNAPTNCRMASITPDDALILPYGPNPCG